MKYTILNYKVEYHWDLSSDVLIILGPLSEAY